MLKLEQINVKTNSLEPFPPNQGGIETQKDEQVEDPQKLLASNTGGYFNPVPLISQHPVECQLLQGASLCSCKCTVLPLPCPTPTRLWEPFRLGKLISSKAPKYCGYNHIPKDTTTKTRQKQGEQPHPQNFVGSMTVFRLGRSGLHFVFFYLLAAVARSFFFVFGMHPWPPWPAL